MRYLSVCSGIEAASVAWEPFGWSPVMFSEIEAYAKKIVDKKADYVLALKGNQGSLREDVELFAAEQNARGFKDTTVSRHETVDGDHGRIETRTYTVIHDVAWLQERHNWPGLQGVVMVESKRETGDNIEQETRFYITSLVMLANQLGPIIRSHWAIENSLHWVMDMTFRDDECRVRTDHAPAWDEEFLVSLIAA